MSTTDFTPERSAAIRQLLIDTVADEPRRRKRLQILLTSILSGIAIALAGGTAALALTGVIHFGADDTPPVPAPTTTQTVTPTPTPTPTPTSTPTPLVQSAPVLPHDVDTLRATTRWSLDLPGDPDCTSATAYTLSDSRVVYVSGLRPKEYEGSDCINHLGEDFGVTLVDTASGTVLWQREWKYASDTVAFGTAFDVLGTSGRALFVARDEGDGPHDVLDLATGKTVGSFRPDWPGFQPAQDLRAVPGDSGDIVVLKHAFDASGKATDGDTVLRADPTDLGNPRWSRDSGMRLSTFGYPASQGTALTMTGSNGQGAAATRMLSLDTGETWALPEAQIRPMSHAFIAESRSDDQLVAYGPDGRQLWTRTLPHGAATFPASTPETVPASEAGILQGDTGELLIGTTDTITLIDQTTGEERWSIPASSCVPSGYVAFGAMLDVRRDAFRLLTNGRGCVVGHQTGALLDVTDLPAQGFALYGLTHLYTYSGAEDPGVAYDLQTGEKLWSRDRHDWESWSFDGGYLVSHRLNRIESIG